MKVEVDTWSAGRPTCGRSAKNVHAMNMLKSLSPPHGSRKCSRQGNPGTTTIKGRLTMGLGRPATHWAHSAYGLATSSPPIAHDFSNLWVIEYSWILPPWRCYFVIQCPWNDKSIKLVESMRPFIGDQSWCLGWNRSREGHMADWVTNMWPAGQECPCNRLVEVGISSTWL
jgi:hypothetical protein